MTPLATTHTHSYTALDLVGNTPLIRLERLDPTLPDGVRLYAKAEWYNPGGSVKDRPALWMIRDGEQRGVLRPRMTIADATSGNTGIAYATIGAALGYKVLLAMPANASIERRNTLYALGAELVLTNPTEGIDLSIQTIRELVQREPERFFYPDQYSNPANWRAHYDTTAPEIWQQTGGQVTHFVAALGTSGTFMGNTRRLRELNPHLTAIAVQPDSPYHALEGVKHMASTLFVPAIYDPHLPDEIITISSETAFAMARRIARREGLLVGISAAANVAAALQVAHRLQRGTVVTILCDSAARYLSDHFWREAGEVSGGEGI